MSDLTPEERKSNYVEEKARVNQVYFKSAPAVDARAAAAQPDPQTEDMVS